MISKKFMFFFWLFVVSIFLWIACAPVAVEPGGDTSEEQEPVQTEEIAPARPTTPPEPEFRDVTLTFPDFPQTANGEDPFALIPQPEECSPDRDSSSGPDYFPLSEFPQEQVDNPFLGPDGFSTAVNFVNGKGQNFEVLVSGVNPQTVADYINQTSVCLEALQTDREPPVVVEPVRYDSIIISAAERVTGQPQSQLSRRRDNMGLEGPATLADVVMSFDSSPDDVLGLSTEIGVDAVNNFGSIRGAPDEVSIRENMDALLYQPGAPFLFDPENLPTDNAGFATQLANDPDNTVVISMEWVDEEAKDLGPDTFFAIWYAIDPSINLYQYRYYQAKCQSTAWVRIRAWAGKMSVNFWRRPPFLNNGNRTANAATSPYPPSLYHSSYPTRMTYDIFVKGLQNGSSYSIYGGWYPGSGGGCG